jgi:hypothetical protein
MIVTVVSFLAILLTAVSFAPSAAHLFELMHKITLGQNDYFVVQGIYRGWALFGFPLCGSVVANLTLAALLRRTGLPFLLATGAGLLMIATLAIFFIWTFPANQATLNWTTIPSNWRDLRQQWEYSHAVNAVVTFVALSLSVLAGLTARR